MGLYDISNIVCVCMCWCVQYVRICNLMCDLTQDFSVLEWTEWFGHTLTDNWFLPLPVCPFFWLSASKSWLGRGVHTQLSWNTAQVLVNLCVRIYCELVYVNSKFTVCLFTIPSKLICLPSLPNLYTYVYSCVCSASYIILLHCNGYLSYINTDSAQCLSYIKFTIFRAGQLVPELVAVGNLESTSFVLSGPIGAFYGFSDSTCINGLGTYTFLRGSEVKGQWPFT